LLKYATAFPNDDVVTFTIGPIRFYLLTSPDAVKTVLIDRDTQMDKLVVNKSIFDRYLYNVLDLQVRPMYLVILGND
jgi:hypothetical protein